MNWRKQFSLIRLAVVASALAGVLSWAQVAAPIELVPGTVNMFRDTRSANDVGIRQGDRLQYGANVVGGSYGITLGATYPPTGYTDPQAPAVPLAVNPNFAANTTPFDINRIAQPWTLRFERAGETPLVVTGPDISATASAVPSPVNVTISAGATPTTPALSWEVPGGFSPDAVRIQVFDKNEILSNGQADIIHSDAILAAANSYTIPTTLSSGQQLVVGGIYVLNVQLIDTRSDPAIFDQTNNNAEILRRSSSFFDFSPIGPGTPTTFLPTVVEGVYNFSITNVGPTFVTFIDPLVAIGYDYAIGAGDPNFASVSLPTGIGDNLFDLFLWNGTSFVDSGINLNGGSQYFFGGVGVDRFSIRGIETSAGLDPENVTAFITGLTFVSPGSFTGTMTPITVETTTSILIDIKPGSYPNSINPKRTRKIPVAILSTEDFDAPYDVDMESLTFGVTGGEESLAFCNPNGKDINGDGLLDLVCHFYTQLTGFGCDDTSEGILMGKTMDNIYIEGSDSVRINPCK